MSQYELRPISKVYCANGEVISKVAYCPSLNHFFLLDDKGRFFLADANGEVLYGPITIEGTSGNSKISIDYLNFHNCLLAWDDGKLNIRRDLGGSWLLKTVLTEKQASISNEVVAVELTLNEATKLLQYLTAPAVKLSSIDEGTMREVLSNLRAAVEDAKEAEKLARGHKWASVLLRGPFNFLMTTLTAALTELKLSNFRLPVLPVLSSVVERLNLLKDQPFIFDIRSEPADIDKSLMASEAARRLTFSQWPHMDYKWALPDQMAEAGFYHQPNTSGDDRVFCFTCTVCLVCWEPADEPWSEHERHSPTCAFVKGEYTQNVPISVTYASSPALPCSCSDKMDYVSKLSHCDWIASSTRYGDVVLWNISKELKKCDPISLDPSEPFVQMKTGYRCRPRRHVKSGVAWADETDILNYRLIPFSHTSGASPSSAGQETMRETSESSNEISGVIPCPQKGDFIVTALCTCGQPASKRTISETLYLDAKCSTALAVGCGIIESKLRTEQRAVETVSSPSSFVENLNTVNKAASVFNECILPPPKSCSSSIDEEDHSTNQSTPRYRPFILVYKVDDAVEERRDTLYTDKSRRTGTVPLSTPAVESYTLSSLKEIDESAEMMTAESLDDDYEPDQIGEDKEVSTDLGDSADEDDKSNVTVDLAPKPTTTWATPTAMVTEYGEKIESTQQAGTSVLDPTDPPVLDPTGPPVLMDTPTFVVTTTGSMTLPVEGKMEKYVSSQIKPSMTILQCLRLPAQLDSSLYYVHSIVPYPDGLSIIVVVNRNENGEKEGATSNAISSAILIYRLSFSCHMTSIVEQPYRQIVFDADVGLLDNVVSIQSLGSGDELNGSNLLAVLAKNGDLRVINADNSAVLAHSSPAEGKKYTAVCAFHEDKLCVACDDGSVCTMEIARTDNVATELENTVQSPLDEFNEWKDPDLLVNKPLTLDVLKDLWQLTRSDWATSGQFSMQAPSSWVEVQQHQRLRKNPQHYLREEKLAKSWHLVPDNDTWMEHLFEITLPANFCASHVDFRFVLHHPASAEMPLIQVTFLRQLPTSTLRSSGRGLGWSIGGSDTACAALPSQENPSTSSAAVQEENGQQPARNHVFNKNFLENLHAEVIAGPYDLNAALDLYNLNGLIQFSSTELNNSKLRTFYIHVQALSKGRSQNAPVKTTSSTTGPQRVRSASSIVSTADSTSATGLYQQKYGSNKSGVYGVKAAAGSARAIQARHEIRKSEDLHGCDWIQEVSVTVWRTKRTILRKEKKQRLAMAKSTDFGTTLVKALASEVLKVKTAAEMDTAACKQYLILDLLTWIISQGITGNKRLVEVAVALEEELDGLIRSCYVLSNRTIARKFTSLIAFIISKLMPLDIRTLCRLMDSLKRIIRNFVFTIEAYNSSGSALWLLALVEEVYKIAPSGCSSFIVEMQEFACRVGAILKQRCEVYRKASPYSRGLCGFPFELEMFEIPPPILTLMQKTQQPFTYAAVATTGTTVTANVCLDFMQDENDWLDYVGVDYNPPDSNNTKSHRRNRLVRLEREQLYGLIEVEPLQFVCYSASDGIKVENLETGGSVPVGGAGNSVPTSTGAGPIPLPDMSQYEQSTNPALTSAVTSMKQQVQSILSKQMQLLAIQQQKHKLQVKLTDHVEKLANLAAEQIPATQASSASTFGVPTTPKTTPFMTPTPLSPSHLSPINSEIDFQFDDNSGTTSDKEFVSAEASGRRNNLVPAEFLKPPPVQALIVDRMSSGARKFLVLSFEQPVLLTDLIIPQCGDIGSLSIDVWLKSESDDGQRLVVCNDISQKTLVLCDLQPPTLCQYLKITYIGRQGLASCTSKIPIGNFYGYTYATPSQLLVVDGVTGGRSFEDIKALRRPALTTDQLRQLEEDVRCRYSLACDQLRYVLESAVSATHDKSVESNMVAEICREITTIRIQWNLLHRAIGRMNLTGQSIGGDLVEAEIGFDKARVISELVMATMIRMSPLIKLEIESMSKFTANHSPKLIMSLESAMDMFDRMCNPGVPNLTAMGVIWILQHGAYSDWWGPFFGQILDRFFACEHDFQRTQKLFLVLSFFVDRGLACGSNSIFLALLQRLNVQLPESLASEKAQWSFQLTLMLLSHCFDSFMHTRTVGSRWDFLLGEYSKRRHSPSKGENDLNGNYNTFNRIVKVGYGFPQDGVVQQSEQLIAQHHQKVVQLSSELKKFVKGKPKQSSFSKHKSSTPHYVATTVAVAPVALKPNEGGGQWPSLNAPESTDNKSNTATQKKPRLKLPFDLCLSVSRKLASLILRADTSISAEIFILMCKILSSITRCSRPLLHMCDVFCSPGQIYELLRNSVVSRNVYMRRSLVCLAQDLLASETKCENARSSTTATRSNSQPVMSQAAGSGESSGTSVESDMEGRGSAKRTQQSAANDAESLAKTLTKLADELQANLSTTAAAASASASASSSTAAAAGSQDYGQYNKPGVVASSIDSFVDTFTPREASTDCKIPYEKRLQRLKYMLTEPLHAYVQKTGMDWLEAVGDDDVNDCLQTLILHELDLANSSQTEEQYDVETGKALVLHASGLLADPIDSKPYPSTMVDPPSSDAVFSASAKTPASMTSNAGWTVTTVAPKTSNLSGSTASSVTVPLDDQALVSYYASMPPPPPVPVSEQNLAEAKDALWKLCEHLSASAAKVSSGYGMLSTDFPDPPPPSFLANPPPSDFLSAPPATSMMMDFSIQSPPETTVDMSLLCDEDSDSESTPMEVDPQWSGPLISYFTSAPVITNPAPPAPAHLWRAHEAYTATDPASSIVTSIQPTSLALDERMESQLGWQSEVWIRRWLLENNRRLRLSLRAAASIRTTNSEASLVQQRDQRISHIHTSSATAISDAFTTLFDSLSPLSSSVYVENLLDTCWLLSIRNDTKTQENVAVASTGTVYLSERAIKKLLAWLLDGIGISERIWCLALRLLATSIRPKATDYTQSGLSGPASGLCVVDEPNFPKVLRRLLTKARSSDSSELAGPAVTQAFYDLLLCIQLYTTGTQRLRIDGVRDTLVKLLLDLLSERDLRTISQLPLDLLNKLLEFLQSNTGTSPLDPRLMTAFANSLSLNLIAYLLSCDPSMEPVLSNGAANPRYCFMIGKPDLTTNEFRCFHDRLDVVMVNLLKLGDKLLNGACGASSSFQRGMVPGGTGESLTDDAKAAVPDTETATAADGLFVAGSSFLENILIAIGLCCGGLSTKTDESTRRKGPENKTPVTAADATLQLLFSFIARIPRDHVINVLTWTTDFLRASENDSRQIRISDLSVYALLWIFDNCSANNPAAYDGAGVVAVIVQQLVRSCKMIDPVPLAEYTHLLKSAAAVCGRGPRPTDSTTKKLSDVKVDGMTNFAPLCSIASSSPMAHHLTSLLNSTPPHRRARSAAWSYHFYPAESWLDVTLTLPYAVILKEVQIRPHLASVQSSPSAIQVELSPDNNPNAFRALAPPIITAGCTKIRISTESFQSPVRMVRLHFKRPYDSANVGMSQILLLGYTPLSSDLVVDDQRVRWLRLLHRSLNFTPATTFFDTSNASLWSSLCNQLVEMFFSVPLHSESYSQLIDVLLVMATRGNMDECDQPLGRLLERVGVVDCSYRPPSTVWLAEAISRLCLDSATNSDTRINTLITWVTSTLEGYLSGRQISLALLRCTIWSCACVLWQWEQNNKNRKINIRADLVRVLHRCARDLDDVGLSKSCGYLLCSIVRIYPSFLDEVLQLCGFGSYTATGGKANVPDELKGARSSTNWTITCADLRVLALVAQSAFAVRALESRGVISYVVNTLTSMCLRDDSNVELIISMVELLRDIATQPFMKDWFNSQEGTLLLVPLLSYLSMSPSRLSTPMDVWRRLESATISFLRRCITCHRESQRLISNLIARLLTNINGGLNSSLQQLVLRVLLEDEKLTVAIDDPKLIRSDFQVYHPQFGCRIHTVVREMSIYASCAQLLPETGTQKSMKNVKKVSYGVCPEPTESTYIYMGDTLSEVSYEGEKAKAKRLATKAQGSDAKSDKLNASAAPTATICPIAYISHAYFGTTNPLPGKLTIGQLYSYTKLLAAGQDMDSLQLEIRYGLTGDVNLNSNDALIQSSPVQSTLEVFARQGGLALLAEHLQLYQPTVNVKNLRIGAAAYTDAQAKDWKILEDMQASASKPFLNDVDLMDYYDPSYEWVNVAPNTESYIVDGAKSHVGGYVRNIASTVLSPHVVVCFGVFLRLPGYAELLVTQDRRQAQWLLRLAMGVTTDALGVNIVSNPEAASMGILPFEILSSLYRTSPWNTDEGRLVRATSIELGIPQLLLRCLSAFSHQVERRPFPVEEKPEVVRVVDQLLATLAYADQPGASHGSNDDKSHLYWAKGTGFGTGSTQQHWNMDLHIVKQKHDEQSVACLLKVLAQFIFPGDVIQVPPQPADTDGPSTSTAPSSTALDADLFATCGHFVRLISDSCLLPTLQSYLRNDSVLDISRHVAVYESVMRMLCSLALCPQLAGLLVEMGDEQQSLRSLLSKLNDCVDIYISKLEPLKKSAEGVGSEEAAAEEGLLKLVPLIEKATQLVRAHKADSDSDELVARIGHSARHSLTTILSNDERYMRAMKPLQFDSFKFLREGNHGLHFSIPFHYESSVQGAAKDIGALAPCVRRLAQEAVTLSTSLPLSYSSSVFVRTAEERLDVMKVLITGPSDTPYANGCFEFDVWFPTDYPNSPMHINLQTTGGSTVRFNPNLYNDGKVCLSILNTWHGRPEERWNAQTSSFLQVLVSIQSLILVSDPYFNEPGYERSRGTPAGQHASREYDANIRQATVRWAMLEMIRSPPACFKTVIQRHFWLKRDEITTMIEGWISDMESGSSAAADKRIQRNFVTHLTTLKKYFNALKEEFARMTPPPGMDDEDTSEGCSSGGKMTGQ